MSKQASQGLTSEAKDKKKPLESSHVQHPARSKVKGYDFNILTDMFNQLLIRTTINPIVEVHKFPDRKSVV